MARFGFGQNFGGGSTSGFRELAVYPAVSRLQTQLNRAKAYYADWTPGANIGTDGRYGSGTHARLKSFITWATRRVPVIEECLATGSDELDRSGPAQVSACMRQTLFDGLSSAELDQIQTAWREWKDAAREPGGGGGGGSIDPYAAARIDCGTRGGTWSDATNTCTEAGADDGMGAGAWIAIALLGALGAYGVYYVATDDGKKK